MDHNFPLPQSSLGRTELEEVPAARRGRIREPPSQATPSLKGKPQRFEPGGFHPPYSYRENTFDMGILGGSGRLPETPEKYSENKKVLQESLDYSLFHPNTNSGLETRNWEASEVRDAVCVCVGGNFRETLLALARVSLCQVWLLCDTWEKEQGQNRKN